MKRELEVEEEGEEEVEEEEEEEEEEGADEGKNEEDSEDEAGCKIKKEKDTARNHSDELEQQEEEATRDSLKSLPDFKDFQEEADRRGILYVTRLPPKMLPFHLRTYMEELGEVNRMYCTPESEQSRLSRKRKGGSGKQRFIDAWVEFNNKKVARRAARLLNGTPIGGPRKSIWHYDLWSVKYLRGFKWHHIREEIRQKQMEAQKKLRVQVTQAKKEALEYLENREQDRVGLIIAEKKKMKEEKRKNTNEGEGDGGDSGENLGNGDDETRENDLLENTNVNTPLQPPSVIQPKSQKLLDDNFLMQFLGKVEEKKDEKEEHTQQHQQVKVQQKTSKRKSAKSKRQRKQ